MKSIAKSKILDYLDHPPAHWPLSRIIWRAGELKIKRAADKIAGLSPTGNEPADYSIAWALGRCGNTTHFPAIQMLEKSGTPTVKRMAAEVALHLAPAAEQAKRIQALKRRLPDKLCQCLENNNEKELAERLAASLSHQNKKNIALLETVYALALKYACCHGAMVRVLKTIPFKEPNYFKAFRRIFKISEFRLDSPIFGIVALRLEEHAPGQWWAQAPFRAETRQYFRRRVWRTLRRLGQAGDDDYVKMAAGILLPYSDEHAKPPETVVRSQWNWDTRQSEVVSTTVYGRFGGYLAFNHILYQHSEQYRPTLGRSAWQRIIETPDTGRVEAFPELWDRHPDAVLDLLVLSRCSIVHEFAVKAVADNEEFCGTISTATIASLLGSVYPGTAGFALELARQRHNPDAPDLALVSACLSAGHAPARDLALQWISRRPDMLNTFPGLLPLMITSPFEEIRERAPEFLETTSFSAEEKLDQLHRVIQLVQDMKEMEEADLAGRLSWIASFILAHYPERQALDLSIIETLLSHHRTAVQIFGGRLLVQLDIPARSIPDTVLAAINRSSNDELKGIGVSLLEKYDDGYLLKRSELLLSYALSHTGPVRRAVCPIIKRLAGQDPEFARKMFRSLTDELFTGEAQEGRHNDILQLIESALAVPLKGMDKNLRWRLIHAKSKAAQQLGAISLEHAAHTDYSVRQWAAFAGCPAMSVRKWAMAAYEGGIEQIKARPLDGLRILNSSWDDARTFGIEYFKTHFTRTEWTPALIIGICDNTRDEIQRFGRELITEFFDQGQGAEYLAKLSQHPSRNVQLFATNYLSVYAANNVKRIKALRPYFLSVLSHVCQGRTAKDRVIRFLLSEALKSEAAANFAAEIFNRQSLTRSLTDKAAYIQSMCRIRETYPKVPLPIQVRELPLKPYPKNEAGHEV